MMRSFADRILAADIATLPVAMLPGTMPLDDAWAQCRSEALDFDVVLVAVASGHLMLFAASHPGKAPTFRSARFRIRCRATWFSKVTHRYGKPLTSSWTRGWRSA